MLTTSSVSPFTFCQWSLFSLSQHTASQALLHSEESRSIIRTSSSLPLSHLQIHTQRNTPIWLYIWGLGRTLYLLFSYWSQVRVISLSLCICLCVREPPWPSFLPRDHQNPWLFLSWNFWWTKSNPWSTFPQNISLISVKSLLIGILIRFHSIAHFGALEQTILNNLLQINNQRKGSDIEKLLNILIVIKKRYFVQAKKLF